MLLTRPRRLLIFRGLAAALLIALLLALAWRRPGTQFASIGPYHTFGLTGWLVVFEAADGSAGRARIIPGGLATALMIAAAAGAICWWSHRRLIGVLTLKGRCDWCGYDLTGLPTPRCPECGQPTADGRQPTADS